MFCFMAPGVQKMGSQGRFEPKYLGRGLAPTLSSFPIPSLPSPFPFRFLPSPLIPRFPFRTRPLKYSYAVWGSAVSSRSEVRGRAPAKIEFCAFYP